MENETGAEEVENNTEEAESDKNDESSAEKTDTDKVTNSEAKKKTGTQVRDPGQGATDKLKKLAGTKPKKVKAQPNKDKKETIKRPVLDYDPTKASSSNLEFPTDIYGCCSKFRQEIIRSASRCCGYPDKMKILKEVIAEGTRHINAKHAENIRLFEAKRQKQREAVKEAALAKEEDK